MANRPCWVKCEVFKGMLSREYCIVVGHDHPGGFVLTDYVRVEHEPTAASAAPGEIQGTVLEEDDTHCLVKLPWESLGQTLLKVPKDDVSPR